MQGMVPLTLAHLVGLGDVERVIVEQMLGILVQQVPVHLLCVDHLRHALEHQGAVQGRVRGIVEPLYSWW